MLSTHVIYKCFAIVLDHHSPCVIALIGVFLEKAHPILHITSCLKKCIRRRVRFFIGGVSVRVAM